MTGPPGPPHSGLPVAVRVRPTRRPPDDPRTAGWSPSPEAFAELLAAHHRLPVAQWTGFSRPWPVVAAPGLLAAPGLPGALGPAALEGPDGRYQLAEDRVLREAAGRETTPLRREPGPTEPAVDLLWFDDLTRWVLRDGGLEAEDRLCRLRLGASRPRLERLLLRGLRVDPGAIDGLDLEPTLPASIEVRRPRELVGESWRDPAAVLGAAEGVEEITRRGDRIEVRRGPSAPQLYVLEPAPAGWRARRLRGDGPVAAIALRCEEDAVAACVELDPRVDPLAPGVRGRLAFDLLSDLVVLGGGPPPPPRPR